MHLSKRLAVIYIRKVKNIAGFLLRTVLRYATLDYPFYVHNIFPRQNKCKPRSLENLHFKLHFEKKSNREFRKLFHISGRIIFHVFFKRMQKSQQIFLFNRITTWRKMNWWFFLVLEMLETHKDSSQFGKRIKNQTKHNYSKKMKFFQILRTVHTS